FFFFQAEDGIRDFHVTGVQTCALPIWREIAGRIVTGFDPETKLFEQFRGYFELETIDLAAYEPRELPIDLVLGQERVLGSQVLRSEERRVGKGGLARWATE